MILQGVVTAMVVATIASASVIMNVPKHIITIPQYTTAFDRVITTEYDSDEIVTTAKPVDMITTAKPVDMITTTKPADKITTMKPADKITTMKPAAPAPAAAQAPMISCHCNLPECLAAAGGDGTCSTRLGCYSEVQPIIPGFEEEIMTPTVTESNNTANGSPIISESVEFVKAPVVATTEHAAAIRGSYGCLDHLNFAKQSCEEILKSMEAEASEFPIMQIPTNGATPSATNAGVHAFHCCQTERCNGNQSGPAEGSVKSVQAVLVAALKNTVAPHPGVQNSTVGVPWTPAVESSVKNMEPETESSSNNVELSNAKKTNAAASDLWLGFHSAYSSSLGEPNAPSPLKSDTIFEDTSSIASPTAMPPTSPVAVPVNEMTTHEETAAKVEHVVIKRHDAPKASKVMKQTIDDQEDIKDFDDDIAAEVKAAIATSKAPTMAALHDSQNSFGSFESYANSWGPRHSGVPDFMPPPSLKKKNITTNSISVTRGVNNDSNSYNIHSENNDSGTNIFGLICTIVVLCIIVLSLLMMYALRTIVRKYDVFRNYKGVCSNPGQPCACNGGLTRRRPRTQPSSSHPGAAAAAVNRNACTAPLLPTSSPGNQHRGHANAGASYNDSIGDTTYVFTAIPAVPNHVAPVRVDRR